MNADLSQFVRDALARGVAREQVRAQLLAARWRPEEIDAALSAWADGEPGLPVPRRRLSLSAREAFQHLVLFATLYIFTFDVGALLFALIESRLRDVAVDTRAGLQTLHWSTAGAVTALPIFLWMNHAIGRALERDPEKRSSGVRRWLTYLTLFVAALVLIGNFSSLVFNLLGGELSRRFLLKSLVVFAIAGLVFGHYLLGLRREESETEARPRPAVWLGRAGVAGAALTILAGLLAGGPPHDARLRALDEKRIENMSTLASLLQEYHDRHHALPDSLAELDLEYMIPDPSRDPQTGRPYGYAVEDSLTYRLSVRFDTGDTLSLGGTAIPHGWRHGKGPHTFRRAVHRSLGEPAPLPPATAPARKPRP